MFVRRNGDSEDGQENNEGGEPAAAQGKAGDKKKKRFGGLGNRFKRKGKGEGKEGEGEEKKEGEGGDDADSNSENSDDASNHEDALQSDDDESYV